MKVLLQQMQQHIPDLFVTSFLGLRLHIIKQTDLRHYPTKGQIFKKITTLYSKCRDLMAALKLALCNWNRHLFQCVSYGVK